MESTNIGDNNLTARAQKEKLKNEVIQQGVLANVQEMLSKMTTKCFQKCVARPAESLGGYEQKCIAMCVDRFTESYNLVGRTYNKRLLYEMSKVNEATPETEVIVMEEEKKKTDKEEI